MVDPGVFVTVRITHLRTAGLRPTGRPHDGHSRRCGNVRGILISETGQEGHVANNHDRKESDKTTVDIVAGGTSQPR